MSNPNRLTKGDAAVGRLTADNGITVGDGTQLLKITAGTVATDFGSIAADETGSKAVTVTGVAAGDLVLISTPDTGTTGVVITGAEVTDTNEVTVYALNVTGGAVDLDSVNVSYLWIDLT